MPSKIVIACSEALAEKGWNIAFAESATGGRMCSEFCLTPLSGTILRGGISCYDVFIKEKILNIPHSLIETFTPESAEVTQALAENAAPFFRSDVTVAVTGLTTSGGSETDDKPVGTMFLHIITPDGPIAHRAVYSGTPDKMILKVIDRMAHLLVENIT